MKSEKAKKKGKKNPASEVSFIWSNPEEEIIAEVRLSDLFLFNKVFDR